MSPFLLLGDSGAVKSSSAGAEQTAWAQTLTLPLPTGRPLGDTVGATDPTSGAVREELTRGKSAKNGAWCLLGPVPVQLLGPGLVMVNGCVLPGQVVVLMQRELSGPSEVRLEWVRGGAPSEVTEHAQNTSLELWLPPPSPSQEPGESRAGEVEVKKSGRKNNMHHCCPY